MSLRVWLRRRGGSRLVVYNRVMKYWVKILSVWLALKVIFYLPFFSGVKLLWPGLSFDLLWKNFDGAYFLAVADSWYSPDRLNALWAWLDRPATYFPAHFPLLPGFIWVFSKMGLSLPWAGVLVTNGFELLMMWVWVRLYQVVYKKLPPWWLVMGIVLLSPRMWVVNSVISPEALFITLTLLAFFFWEKEKYLLAVFHAVLAFWTKSPAFFIFAAFGLWLWLVEHKASLWLTIKDKRSWLVIFGGLLAFIGLNWFFYLKTGNFWAYFQSGDNMHLFFPPLQVFNPKQVWVGSFWLEDVVLLLSLYSLLLIRSWNKFKEKPFWVFSALFLSSLFFVAHRDISRYALPVVPVLILMNADGFKGLEMDKRRNRVIVAIYIVLTFFYGWNFINGNHP